MMITNRFIKIGAAAELLGVSIDTLRKWELSGELIPDRKSQAGTRFYDSSNGEVFPGAKYYRNLEVKLSRLQYLNRHKVKFSSNWKKAQLKIASVTQ